ncbi:hypothetical protein HZS_1438, partial [Henneguya salminicola]
YNSREYYKIHKLSLILLHLLIRLLQRKKIKFINISAWSHIREILINESHQFLKLLLKINIITPLDHGKHDIGLSDRLAKLKWDQRPDHNVEKIILRCFVSNLLKKRLLLDVDINANYTSTHITKERCQRLV